MNLKSKFKRILSGVLSFAVTTSILPCFPVFADEQTEPEKYPYTMFAASDSDGAITINANNFCVNGNIATNGTIVSSGNMNVNGTRTENADEEMIHILKKLNYSYFSGDNVEVYVEDYSFEDLNININNPMDVYGSLELTGNINLNSGIKAYEDVTINGEVKNTNEAVICSETGDIIIETTNVNFNGLIYAPYGDIIIDTDNLNLNNVVIIGQTITLDCPNVNANYSRNTAELVGTESDIDVELYAFGEYNSEANSIDIEWYTNYSNSSYEIWISDDNEEYTSVGVVTDGTTYQYPITEDFEKRYFKISLTTNYGEYIESIPFVVTKNENGYSVDFLDSDEDGLPDIYEILIGTDINKIDSDDDDLTDYQEVYITGTDPTVYDSVTEGVSDADADSDGDGLSNAHEIELGTDPLLSDTDDDNLSDYDELYIYGTEPLIPDTDGDGLEDGDEPHIGLDPTNPETFGIPDAEYKVEQTISTDSGVLSEINTAENAYELSIDIKTNGYAEKEVTVSKSGYSYAIENDAMIGLSADIFISDTCNPEEIVLKYNIKEAYIDNTLNLYSSLEEFQGIKRLNIFKFHEDKNMLLPVETEFDVENGLLYAEVDELGTYCIMDMEIWLNNLGIEMPEEIKHEENAMYLNSPSILSASEDSGSVWTPTYTNAPIDLVFILQTAGKSQDVFEKDKTLIENFCLHVFEKYSNINVQIVTFGKNSAKLLKSKKGNKYLRNLDAVKYALSTTTYTPEFGYCDRGQAFKLLLCDMTLRENADVFIYQMVNGRTDVNINFDQIDLMNNKLGSYSEISYNGWHYNDDRYGSEIKNMIEKNGDLFITINDSTLSAMEKHLERKKSPLRPVYEILLPTKWKKIALKGELNSTNKINSDEDSLTDWEEVNIDELIKLSNGNYILPKVTVKALAGSLKRYGGDKYLFITENKVPNYYLPILSNPTEEDSDGDGILDPDEYTNLTTDSRYDNIDPLKADTLETLYPELTRNSKTNVDTNPIYIDINDNTIALKVKYKLNNKAYELSNIMKPDSTEYYTNEEIIMKSISDKWNTEIQGNIFDFYPGMSIKTEVNLIEASSKEKYIKFKINDKNENTTGTKFGVDWTTKNIKYIELSTRDGEGKYLAEVNRFAAPAHELGHALGLSDLYGNNTKKRSHRRLQPVIYDISKTTQNEIWYSEDGNNSDGDLMYSFGLVRANDIEMILQAYCDNQKQYFKPEIGKNICISKVIKQNQDNTYLDRINKEFVIYEPESKTTTSIGDACAYQIWLKDNYGINVTISELEQIYGKNNITST